MLNLAEAGDHIVSSAAALRRHLQPVPLHASRSWASTVTFVDDPDDLDAWRAAVRPNTKAFFAETISNPQIDVLDIAGVSPTSPTRTACR